MNNPILCTVKEITANGYVIFDFITTPFWGLDNLKYFCKFLQGSAKKNRGQRSRYIL